MEPIDLLLHLRDATLQGKHTAMRTALLMIAVSAMVYGCVAYAPDFDHGPQYGKGYRYHDGGRYRIERDRDGDGVPDWQDRRPDNPRRY